MKLTEHFTLEEFCQSDTATRLGIANAPPPRAEANLKVTAQLMELIRAALSEKAGVDVAIHTNSGFRCEELERILTAKDFARWCARRGYATDAAASWRMYFNVKAHPDGRAVDFTAPRFGTPYQIVQFIASRPDIMRHIDQIIMEGTWAHVAWRDKPRHEVKTATFVNGEPQYSLGLS